MTAEEVIAELAGLSPSERTRVLKVCERLGTTSANEPKTSMVDKALRACGIHLPKTLGSIAREIKRADETWSSFFARYDPKLPYIKQQAVVNFACRMVKEHIYADGKRSPILLIRTLQSQGATLIEEFFPGYAESGLLYLIADGNIRLRGNHARI